MENSIRVVTDGQTAPSVIEEQVLGIVREVLGRAEIGPDDDVFDHGGTSLSFVRILAQINKHHAVMVNAASLGGRATARNLAARVVESAGPTLDSEGV